MKSTIRTALFVLATAAVPFAAHAADDAKGDSKPVQSVKDSAITVKVKSNLAAERDGFTKSISVKTTDAGVVTLTGTALTKADSDKAESIARNTKGVTAVTNNIVVKN